MPRDPDDFIGTKIVATLGDCLLTFLRDDLPHIPFPNRWDLPGGGREGRESAETCALRELHEEFGLALPAIRLLSRHYFPATEEPQEIAVMFTLALRPHDLRRIRFGDEGQHWRLMPVADYVRHPHAVGPFRDRVRVCLGLPDPGFAGEPQA
ncbi:NUDIX domain-containing protein [Paracoccus jiaweipingae]|uniref:NUDIX domain-containing protein n=1 Tax=unclassified Paracoccus (in: a-proteobacteria) TaxID=2688777 RepID=UPI0037A3FC25